MVLPPDETIDESWEAPQSVGHPVLDDDHAKLWRLTLSFRQAAHAGKPSQAMDLFECLMTGLQAHFLREELLLSGHDAAGLDSHRQEHNRVLRQFMLIGSESFLFLRSWPGLAGDLACSLMLASLAHDLSEIAGFPLSTPLCPLSFSEIPAQ